MDNACGDGPTSSTSSPTSDSFINLVLKCTLGAAAAGVLYVRHQTVRQSIEREERERKASERRRQAQRDRELQDEAIKNLMPKKKNSIKNRNNQRDNSNRQTNGTDAYVRAVQEEKENRDGDGPSVAGRETVKVQSYELMYDYDTYSSGSDTDDEGSDEQDPENASKTTEETKHQSSQTAGSSSSPSPSAAIRVPYYGKVSLPTLVNDKANSFQIDFSTAVKPSRIQTFYVGWKPSCMYVGPAIPTPPLLAYDMNVVQDNTGRIYALKSLFCTRSFDWDATWDHLTTECQLQTRAAGPNTLGVYGMWSMNSVIVACFEHAKCDSLRSRIFPKNTWSATSGVRMSECEAARVVKAVAMGLLCCHNRDILHLGISLDSVYECQDGTIKIGGFSSARKMDEYGCAHIGYLLVGAPVPEEYTTEGIEGKYWPSSDIWLAGIVLFEILNGTKIDLHRLCKASTFELTFHDGVSELAKDLTTRMLSIIPERRPTAQELIKDPWVVKETAS